MRSTVRTRLERLPRLVLIVLPALSSGCDKPRSIGDVNEILVAAPAPVWTSLEDGIKQVLEPRTFSFREERVFDIAHIAPAEPRWADLRFRRQILVVGPLSEPAVAEAMENYRGDAVAPPTIVQVRNVWAQNQLVTILLLPEGGSPAAAESLLPRLGDIYLRQYEEYARARMFATRPNDALTDSLRSSAGFSVVLPQVYRYERPEEGVHVFRNDQPDPSRLIRNITVASRPAGEVQVTPEAAAEWRAALASRLTHPPQVTEAFRDVREVEIGGAAGVQVQGPWSNPPGEWPAAGHFIARMLSCPSRVFLIDAWLYAPGLPKFEYMYQLDTILNSFQCA